MILDSFLPTHSNAEKNAADGLLDTGVRCPFRIAPEQILKKVNGLQTDTHIPDRICSYLSEQLANAPLELLQAAARGFVDDTPELGKPTLANKHTGALES